MTPRLLMEEFQQHCGRIRISGKTMSFSHFGLVSPGPYGAFRRAIQSPEAVQCNGDKSGLWGQTQHIQVLAPLTGCVTLVK